MPYKLIDYVPGRIIYTHIYGDYSRTEMEQSNTDILVYLNRYNTPVHVISDFTHMTSFVHDVSVLVKTFDFFAHPHQGWSIVVSPNPMVRVVSTAVVQQIKGADVNVMMRAFGDRQAALAFLARIDLTLPALPPLVLDEASL